MSKTAHYAGARWAGSVTFRDPLYLPDALAIEEAQELAEKSREETATVSTVTKIHSAWLPVICAVVEKWELADFPADPSPATFPGSPRIEAAKLVAWLIGQVMEIYQGDAERVDPNG